MSAIGDFPSSNYSHGVASYSNAGFEDEDSANYVRHLTQAWINERAAPDILQYEQSAVDGLLSKIEEQTAVIDELDPTSDTLMIISILYQTELERVKFVLRSYLRTRISKFCEYLLSNEDKKLERLSTAEKDYAQNYSRATRQHYHSSFLSSLPQSLQLQNDVVFDRKLSMAKTSPVRLVSKPNLDEAVFCRVIAEIGDYQIDDGEELYLEPGQTFIFRYGAIRSLLEEGKIELI
ncbi:GINS complex subunit [Haplosporangium sp. Z 27]|nr:GINS complex subunit [Haplosporangium sp. Z 27]